MRKKFLLIILVIFLIIFFTPLASKLYKLIIGRNITSWFLGSSHPEYFEGFFISYAFFISFFVTLFSNNKKYKILTILLGVLLFLDIVISAWEGLIIDMGVIIFGWALAQGVLYLKSKINRR